MVSHSIPVDEHLLRKLEELAKKSGRDVQDVAADALRDYVEYTSYVVEHIEAGIKDADAGRVMTTDETRAWLRTRREKR